MIEFANKSDALVLAKLHKENIDQGFLSQLSYSFLSSLYLFLIMNELIYVAREETKIVGFVSYSYSSEGIIKRFVISNPLVVFSLFLSIIKKPSLFKSVSETIKAPKKSSNQTQSEELIPSGELLSITVDAGQQKNGTGTLLLHALEDHLTKKNVQSYKVIAGESLVGANKFYKKNGFKILKTITIHGNSVSNLYVKEI